MPAGADVEEVYGARGCLVQDVVVEEGHMALQLHRSTRAGALGAQAAAANQLMPHWLM